MKYILLAVFFSFSLLGYSQNWKPINPKWSSQYAATDSTTIDYCTKVDSVIGNIEQTTFYLHPTYIDCAECESSDENPLGVYLKKSPMFGERIVEEENSYSFFGLGLILKPSVNFGDSYTFSFDGGEEITATVIGYNETTVLEETDSVKTFSYSNGMEMILSKNHGIISFTAENGNTETLGGIPELGSGIYYPGIRDFYDFEVGDVFMYLSSYGEDEPYWYDKMTRVEVTAVNYSQDTLSVTYSAAQRTTTSYSQFGNWTTYTGYNFSENGVQKFYLHNKSLQGLIPGMMTFPVDSIQVFGNINASETYFIPDVYGPGYYVDSTAYNGRTALSIGGVEPAFNDTSGIDSNGDVFCMPCNTTWMPESQERQNGIPINTNSNTPMVNYNFLLNDSLKKADFYFWDVCSGYTTYAEGLGIVANVAGCNLNGSSFFMIGYRKGEEEYGTIYTLDDILNGVVEISKIDVKIFPNPSHGFFVVDIPESYIHSFTISMVDLSGREVFRESGYKGKNRISTENLSVGVYILQGQNEDYTFSQKVVIE